VNGYLAIARARLAYGVFFALTIASIVETQLTRHTTHQGWLLVAALGWSLPFFFRDRYPFWAPLSALPFIAAAALFEPAKTTYNFSAPFLAAITAMLLFGLNDDRRSAVVGWCAVVATGALVVTRGGSSPENLGWTVGLLTLPWVFGRVLSARARQTGALRERVARADEERREAAETAVAAERARIAREVQDIVAHSVSVMVVQTAGVRRLLGTDQERERNALLAVEQTGREALEEIRRLVATADGASAGRTPQPGLDQLAPLVAEIERAGLPVALSVEGARAGELPPGIDLTAYRIVQEGLENALRNGGGQAEVAVRYHRDRVELEVTECDAPGGSDDTGSVLAGVQERVELYGGTFESGPSAGGGFSVRAVLPLRAAG
jgi:signal transduction histidine kinase